MFKKRNVEIVSLVSGIVSSFGLEKNGNTFSCRIEIDTLSLHRVGFKQCVLLNSIIKNGTSIMSADLKLLKSKGYDSSILVNILNIYFKKINRKVSFGDSICDLS